MQPQFQTASLRPLPINNRRYYNVSQQVKRLSNLKKRILNFGTSATHDLITNLPALNDPTSISDFDGFVFDPQAVRNGGFTVEHYLRRRQELRDLVVAKGGLVVCLVRPSEYAGYSVPGRNPTTYDMLDLAMGNSLAQIQGVLRAGRGSRIDMVPSSAGACLGYLRVLGNSLNFAAYLETTASQLASFSGTVLAVDSVAHPVAFEFAVGPGRVCFVPIPEGALGDRVGSAIMRIVDSHYGGPGEIESPAWMNEVSVPGGNAYDDKIAQLEATKRHVEEEIEQLNRKRTEILNYRLLLYGYGDSVLEPIVRAACVLIGFEVPEPEQYTGEWDIELHDPVTSATALGEVEGSQGPVDVDKYRQLLDYVQAEVLEGRDHKGILIGNGFG